MVRIVERRGGVLLARESIVGMGQVKEDLYVRSITRYIKQSSSSIVSKLTFRNLVLFPSEGIAITKEIIGALNRLKISALALHCDAATLQTLYF
jgi:hypothetical protein